MRDNFKFILERYRSGGSNRYTCPACGDKKKFTRYINTETGEYVADNCGICDHANSCGYHYTPHEYFRDHPEALQKKPWESPVVNARCLANLNNNFEIMQPFRHQTEFYDIHWAELSRERNCTFTTWFRSLPFDAERIEHVLRDYYVGATAYDIVADGVNHGPAVIFWMIDEQMRVHDAKLMAYTQDGHRVPNWVNSMRALCCKKGIGPQLLETEKVLFGLHLLSRYQESAVCIVESEKTALVCACVYPQYLWLATGGCSNLQAQKLLPLMDRHIALFPDSGMYEKWSKMMQKTGHRSYNITDYFEQYEPNTDIADVILGVAKLQPF